MRACTCASSCVWHVHGMCTQACEYGSNPYFFAPMGDNVWEYWFKQPAGYALGATHVRGRPVAS